MKNLLLLAVAVLFLGLTNAIYANGVTGQNLQDGLVAWYKFDGNANDSSGNGNNGTVHGASFTTDRTGNVNGACLFEGDDWVVVPHSASLSVDALTISVWINPSGWYDTYWGGNMPIVCKANGGFEGSYRYQIEKRSGADVILHNVGLEGLRLNVWQQLTITTGNGTTCVYLNGQCVGCVQRETIRQYSDVLNIGRNVVGTSGEYYLGAMDDLRIYNRALSAAEIAALYDGVADREVTQGQFDSDWTKEGTLDIKSGVRQVGGEIMLAYDSSWVKNGVSVALKVDGTSIATVNGAGAYAWNVEPGSYVLEHQVLNAEGNPIGMPESVPVEFVKQLSVSFDLNGGVGGIAARTFNIGFSYGSLPIVTTSMRPGYTFVGWFTAAQGGAEVTAGSVVSERVTRLYAHWSANPYTVRFNANGGEGTMGDLNCTYGMGTVLTACAFTRTGYTFAGWAKSAAGTVMYTDRANVTDVAASGTVTLYAKWTPITYSVKFNAIGGSGSMSNLAMTYDVSKALTACAFTKTGYAFVGWATSADGEVVYTNGQTVRNLTATQGAVINLYAKWNVNSYAVKFNANGGQGTMANQAFVYDAPQNLTMNGFTRAGCEFLGWATSSAGEVVYADGEAVCNLTATADGVVNLYAVWDATGLVDPSETSIDNAQGEVAPYVAAATVYDGYLYDGDKVVGSVQVKVAKGKVNKNSDKFEAKVTATVQLADGSKKISFKGGVADEAGRVTGLTAAGHTLDISLGVDGMGGAMDGKSVDGARNLFSAKDADSKSIAAAIEKKWVGAVNVVGDDVVLSVAIAKKGKVKVSGIVEGAKVSATSQLLVGAEACCVPVVITKKANLAFNLWLMADGSVEVVGLDGAVAGKAEGLKAGAAFRMDGAAGVRALPGLYGEYLPNGVGVAQSGTKWVVAGGAKAGKLALVKGTSEIDSAKSKFTENMSGLKFTYKAKDGSFKGSFKAYALENGKIKSYTVNVTGVMIGAKGYGTATLKKPSCSFPITIE